MAIRPDDQIPGADEPLFGQEGVLDAHLADLEVVGDLVVAGERPHRLGLLGGLDVLVRGEVVGHEGDLLFVKDRLLAELGELIDGDRGGDVVSKHQIQVGHDQLAGTYALKACMRRQNLL